MYQDEPKHTKENSKTNNFGYMNGWTKNVYGLAHKL